MYAIIESCGRQYKVTEGDVVFFEKLEAEEGKKVTFDNVVLVSDDKKVEVGAPYVKGVKVEGKVVSHGKGKKILVYKYKAKKNYRRTQGHRQPYTKVEITRIKMPTEKAEAKVEKAEVKETAAKATTKKATTKKTSVKKPEVLEYYDLPYRYNQTVIKVLAQTPTTLFIYWDISDEDRENYKKQYGENFFDITKPVLIVYNDTLGYNFEVEINDFANSWYLHVADSKCDYRIELGRRPIINNDKLNTDYIFISNSNEIESPNDKILFNKQQKMIYFRNTKTNKETQKSINNISFLTNMGKIYDIYDLYKLIYKNENVEEIYNTSNPSSGNPSSHF